MRKTFPILMIIIISMVTGAYNKLEAQAQSVRWFRVGSLHSWFSSLGAELEIGRTGNANEQLDGLRWDAQFQYQDTDVAKSLWIGSTNYTDPLADNTFFPHKVVAVGPRRADPIGEIMPYEFRMIGRFTAPLVLVDGEVATENRLNDIVDEIDENLTADRMIVNKLHSSMGISYSRKLMAFSQQNHDNYFVYEYVFKNTGIIDLEGTVVEKTLTDVIFFLQYRYGFGLEAFRCTGCRWAPSNGITWGINTVNHAIGRDPNAADFEMRAQYSWYGRHSLSPVSTLGLPYHNGDGHLAAPQFAGTVTLHADKSASDKSDDPFQPTTTFHIGSDLGPQGSKQFDATLMTRMMARLEVFP